MTDPEKLADLEARVDAFFLMELPGQMQMIHMGTSYLITDLWNELRSVNTKDRKAHDIVRRAAALLKEDAP